MTVVPGFLSSSGFTPISSTGTLSFNLGDGTTGTLQEQVGTLSTNPHGGLTFTFQFTVNSGLVEHMSSSSFTNFLTDVANDNTAPGTVAPATANRSGNSDGGRVVEFNGEWIAGQTSAILMINTDAKSFTAGTIGLIDGGGTTLAGFAPVALVPEPGSLFLLGGTILGLGGAAAWRRRWTLSLE
jgi:hypothetical protein